MNVRYVRFPRVGGQTRRTARKREGDDNKGWDEDARVPPKH